MPRNRKQRQCRFLEGQRVFKPPRIPMSELTLYTIGIDEFEAMRLCDHEGLSQIEASERMKISRGTVQRLLERGRRTLLEGILSNSAVAISDNAISHSERVRRAPDL
ncbi:MAG TPA: DUF134 domain-containing protein [Spirochaetia bacterium]|nr:DUF134 domain-containing protein [Spirochaetia bacterium]